MLTTAPYFPLIALLAGAVTCIAGDALAAEAAEKVARVAYVGTDPALSSSSVRTFDAFRSRMSELGWKEGQNLVIDQHWTEGRQDRFPALMRDALTGKPDVVITASTPGALAAKHATSTVPIIVAAMGDPIQAGLVSSLARPGGNITALSVGYADAFAGKWLELALELVPHAKTVAVIWNLGNPVVLQYQSALEEAAAARAVSVKFIDVRDARGLDSAFRQAARTAQAAVVTCENLFILNAQRVVDLAAFNRIPSVYCLSRFAALGGLVSYGVDLPAMYRRAAEYTDKVLRGSKVGDLPVEQPTKYELVVNLHTAKQLGIIIPESVLSRADEVIH